MGKRKLSNKFPDAKSMYEAGKSCEEVAAFYGCDPSNMYGFLKRRGTIFRESNVTKHHRLNGIVYTPKVRAAGPCSKCGTLKENPHASYCRACARAYTSEKRKANPEEFRRREREAYAKMTPEEKADFREQKNKSRRAWLARRPDIRARRNAEANEKRKTWGPERVAIQKERMLKHYDKLQLRRAEGLCGHSLKCQNPPIGESKFCLFHWCAARRHDDIRQKCECTVEELVNLWLSQQEKCAVTGVRIIPGKTAVLDHVNPVANEGPTTIGNLRFVHTAINWFKWAYTEDEFKQIVRELLPGLIEWSK
jgi:hypothetical protein